LNESLHFAILDDVHTQRRGGARIAPRDGIMARGPRAPLRKAAEHRHARLRR
jgi:hypothetical protein